VPLCRLQAVLNARLNGDSLPLTDIDGDEIHICRSSKSPHLQDRLDVMWVAYGRGQPTLCQTATEHIRRRELGEDFTRRIQCSTCPHQIATVDHGRPCVAKHCHCRQRTSCQMQGSPSPTVVVVVVDENEKIRTKYHCTLYMYNTLLLKYILSTTYNLYNVL
jgi:hypothetical protein